MTRRKFILLGLAALVTLVGGFLVIVPFEKVVTRILRNQLSYLPIDDSVFLSFENEITKANYYTENYGFLKTAYIRFFSLLDNSLFKWPGQGSYDKFVTFFVQDFLLSTDFFHNKMDESKPVTYVVLYQPYERGCSNPFSNLYYPEVA